MQCPKCEQIFRILKSRLFDYTRCALGCPVRGRWPNYTAKIYVDNIELLECNCGVCVNLPDIDGLHYTFFPEEQVLKSSKVDTSRIDPYSNLIYVGLWDDDDQGWTLTAHREN